MLTRAQRYQIGAQFAGLSHDDLFRSAALQPRNEGCHLRPGVTRRSHSLG
jgi:hypothetical protein